MFRTIVAGCDGVERGREAAAFAAALADATSARLLLVASFQEPPLPFPEPFREHAEQVDRAIRGTRDELAPNADVMTVEALSPAHALRHVARHEHADLIVVGSRHRRGILRIVETDHALQVLHSAPESVAVIPDGTVLKRRFERIVVGLDGSPESRSASDLAAGLARATGARLWLQVVVDDRRPTWARHAVPAGSAPWSASVEQQRSAAQALLDGTLAELSDVDAEGAVSVGNPVLELTDAAKGSDLLVLGSRRWGPVSRLALGSTAEAVVRRGAGPVLVLPRTLNRPQARMADAAARATTR
jgi:nucleotide-binding universal stress UspA family protein